jgi:hypothetical protein
MRRNWPQQLWGSGQRLVFAKLRLAHTSTTE